MARLSPGDKTRLHRLQVQLKDLGRFRATFLQYKWALPWLFLAYGVVSAVTLTRDYHHTTRLLVFSLGLFPVFLIYGFWDRVLDRLSQNPHFLGRFGHLLTRYQEQTAWLVSSMMQNLSQYILMFCIPYLWQGRHWAYLGITLGILATALWDPWWNRMVGNPVYRYLIRTWCVLLGTSFLLVILYPTFLEKMHPAMLIGVTVASFPYKIFFRKHYNRPWLIFGHIALFCLLISAVHFFPKEWRFPPLSVWLRDPHMGVDVHLPGGPEKLLGPISRDIAQDFLRQGNGICCVSPVIAPPGFQEKMIQVWEIDGKEIERQSLRREVKGNPKEVPFNTYTCKRNLPSLKTAKRITCKVFLSDDVFLGSVHLNLN